MAKVNMAYARKKTSMSEATAKKVIAVRNNVDPATLVANHSPKMWVFTISESAPVETDYPFGKFSFEKTENATFQDAMTAAMDHFETFEANVIHLEDQDDETHYVFTKRK